MKISLTGTLQGFTRKQAVEMIEAVGATYSKNVTYETNYLVATTLDSNKAERAREIGVEVISQSEFEDFVELGQFPENELPEKRQFNREINRENYFPQFDWKPAPAELQDIGAVEYFDSDGVVTERKVLLTHIAEYTNKVGITRVYYRARDLSDDQRIKTFRQDRIITLSR